MPDVKWRYIHRDKNGKKHTDKIAKTDLVHETIFDCLVKGERVHVKVAAWRYNKRWKVFTITDQEDGVHIIKQVRE